MVIQEIGVSEANAASIFGVENVFFVLINHWGILNSGMSIVR
jgi:hypothetical protein